jgi:hypothetical protein
VAVNTKDTNTSAQKRVHPCNISVQKNEKAVGKSTTVKQAK